MLEHAVELGKVNLSEDDPDVLVTALQLGTVLQQADDPSAARRVLEEAYAAGQWRLGDSDALMVRISHDIGVVAEELGNRHEARKAFTRVAEFGPAALGAGHPAVARAMAYLGPGQGPSPVRGEFAPPQPVAQPRPAPAVPQQQAPSPLEAAVPPPQHNPFRPATAAPEQAAFPQAQPPAQPSPFSGDEDSDAADNNPTRVFPAIDPEAPPARPGAVQPPSPTNQHVWTGPIAEPRANPVPAPRSSPVEEPTIAQPILSPPPEPTFLPPAAFDSPHIPAQRPAPGYPSAPSSSPGHPNTPSNSPNYPDPPSSGPGYSSAPPDSPGYPSAPFDSPGHPGTPANDHGYLSAPFNSAGYPGTPASGPGYPGAPGSTQVFAPAYPSDEPPPYAQGSSTPTGRKGLGVFAAIAAVLAAVIAVAALVFVLANRTSDSSDNGNVPTLAGQAPTGVELRDTGTVIDVTWTDPTQSSVSFMVIMGRPGLELKPVGTLGPGQTSFEMSGLNPSVNYCFAVVAVYSGNQFATSPQACTKRASATPR